MAASLTEGRAPFAASVASVFLVYVKEVTVTWVPFLGTAEEECLTWPVVKSSN